MNFSSTKLAGVWIVDMERHGDDRGWFARTWCAGEFALGCDLLFAIVWSSLQGGRRVTLAEVPSDLTITGRSGDLFA